MRLCHRCRRHSLGKVQLKPTIPTLIISTKKLVIASRRRSDLPPHCVGDCFVARKPRALLAVTGAWVSSIQSGARARTMGYSE